MDSALTLGKNGAWERVSFRQIILDYDDLARKIACLRELGCKIVLTSGSYDVVHIGHMEYLAKAKEHGHVLVVGVDSDAKIRKRKGPDRPVVPEDERMRILFRLEPVNIVTLKQEGDPKWHLIRTVRPDVLILSERTGYGDDEQARLQELCGEIVVLPPQAETSTTARIRELEITGGRKLTDMILQRLAPELGPLITSVSGPLAEALQTSVSGHIARAVAEVTKEIEAAVPGLVESAVADLRSRIESLVPGLVTQALADFRDGKKPAQAVPVEREEEPRGLVAV